MTNRVGVEFVVLKEIFNKTLRKVLCIESKVFLLKRKV